METLLLIPVDDSVVYPNMQVTLAIDAGSEDRVVLVPRKGDEFASVGTVAQVTDRVRLPGGARAVALDGLHRGLVGAARTLGARPRRVLVTVVLPLAAPGIVALAWAPYWLDAQGGLKPAWT